MPCGDPREPGLRSDRAQHVQAPRGYRTRQGEVRLLGSTAVRAARPSP